MVAIRYRNRPYQPTAAGSAASSSRRGTSPTNPTLRGRGGTGRWLVQNFRRATLYLKNCGVGGSTWIKWRI